MRACCPPSRKIGNQLYHRYLDELEYADQLGFDGIAVNEHHQTAYGIGWEYFGHSINPTKSRARLNEAHDLIIKAWTSPEMFQWISPNYEYRYVNLWPRPLQQPHPPVFIPGAGSTETMKFCAERRYTYMSVYATSRRTARPSRSWSGCPQGAQAARRDAHPARVHVAVVAARRPDVRHEARAGSLGRLTWGA